MANDQTYLICHQREPTRYIRVIGDKKKYLVTRREWGLAEIHLKL